MKNQHRGKSIYPYPVLLIVIAILVNGCAELWCEATAPICVEARHISTVQVYNIEIPPHDISSVEVNIELKDNIHLSDVTGQDNADISQPHKFSLIDYKLALIQALIDFNYNGNTLQSKYILHAELIEIDQPSWSINKTVTTIVEYILKERNSGKRMFRKTIETSYTASLRDYPGYETRIIKATEGSVRENIYEFLKALSELIIKKHQVSIGM